MNTLGGSQHIVHFRFNPEGTPEVWTKLRMAFRVIMATGSATYTWAEFYAGFASSGATTGPLSIPSPTFYGVMFGLTSMDHLNWTYVTGPPAYYTCPMCYPVLVKGTGLSRGSGDAYGRVFGVTKHSMIMVELENSGANYTLRWWMPSPASYAAYDFSLDTLLEEIQKPQPNLLKLAQPASFPTIANDGTYLSAVALAWSQVVPITIQDLCIYRWA